MKKLYRRFKKLRNILGKYITVTLTRMQHPSFTYSKCMHPWSFACINVLDFLRKTPSRGSSTTTRFTTFFFGTSKVGLSAKEKLRNEKMLLVLQKCNPQSRKWLHRQSGASLLRVDKVWSEPKIKMRKSWSIERYFSPKFTRCCNFSSARWP